MAIVSTNNWKNKASTSDRICKCGSWQEHWINFSKNSWPRECSISNCKNKATLGAHVINSSIKGERIIPTCASCNKLSGEFRLKNGEILVLANHSETCANF